MIIGGYLFVINHELHILNQRGYVRFICTQYLRDKMQSNVVLVLRSQCTGRLNFEVFRPPINDFALLLFAPALLNDGRVFCCFAIRLEGIG